MTSVYYACAAGNKTKVNVYGFKKPPKIIKLKGSWYFQECIKCKIKTSTDYYFNQGKAFSENTIEGEGYCKLKLVEGKSTRKRRRLNIKSSDVITVTSMKHHLKDVRNVL